MNAVWLSLQVGLLAAVLGLPPAMALGYLLARKRFLGHGLLSALVLVPMVLPPVVTGLLLLEVVGRNTALGGALADMGLPLSFSFGGAVLAALIVGLPLYVWSARAAFTAVDPRLEELGATLGAPPRQQFWRITFPLALPGLAAGAVLAFARGLGEFGATAVLAGNIEGETRTISLAVYQLMEDPSGQGVGLLVAASVLLSLGALLAFEGLNRWQQRRLDQP
ncbi:MAG: molybdate transport system permease protein [Cognaticolwellia sp.]|jgi:molybdate transport system permease protein